MNSLVIDLVVCGLAYVISVYFVTVLTKNLINKGRSGNNGDGGVQNTTPPQIDLPPGVIWPTDAPKKSIKPEPVEG